MRIVTIVIATSFFFSCSQVKKQPGVQSAYQRYAVAPAVTTVIPASVIVEDSMRMFVSYLEKATWSKPVLNTTMNANAIILDDSRQFVTKTQITNWTKVASLITETQVKAWNTDTTFKSGANIEFLKINDSTYQVNYVIKQLNATEMRAWTAAPPMTFVYNTDDKHIYFKVGTTWSMLWSS